MQYVQRNCTGPSLHIAKSSWKRRYIKEYWLSFSQGFIFFGFVIIDTKNLSYFYHIHDGSGGYVGLFIGYTISQAPSLLLSFITWIRTVPKSLKQMLSNNGNGY